MKFIEMTSENYGKLVVLNRSGKDKQGRVKWLCQCSCGKKKEIRGCHLRSGEIKSCGCLISESTTKRFTTHGLRKKRIYKIWVDMRTRCNNENSKSYYTYGNRGIKVCYSWNSSFENFYNDMKKGYNNSLTIERIDNDKGYFKENCRWATNTEQARNKNNNTLNEEIVKVIRYYFNKKRYGVSRIASAINICRSNVYHVVKNNTWKNIGV